MESRLLTASSPGSLPGISYLGLLLLLVSSCCGSIEAFSFPVHVSTPDGKLSSCTFPSILHVEIRSGDQPFLQFLALHRNDVIDTEVTTYAAKQGPDGGLFLERMNIASKDSAAYQNTNHGAAFIFTCTTDSVQLEGTLFVDGRKYRVRPSPTQDSNLLGFVNYEFQYVDVSFRNSCYNNDEQRLKYAFNRDDAQSQNSALPETRDPHVARVRRGTRAEATPVDYYIDVMVWLDYSFFQYWVKRTGDATSATIAARKYIAYIFNGVNARFSSVTGSGFKIHIRLPSIAISQTAAGAPWIESHKQGSGPTTSVEADTALEKIKSFVNSSYSALPKHDHLMFITEYDLYGTDNGFRFNNTAGFAYINTTCLRDGTSVSIVEDHGGFQSEGTVTHELGHSMGAMHDGNGNGCSAADRYVMSGSYVPETESTKRNPWIFSSCSVAYFASHIQDLIDKGYENTCLLHRVEVNQTEVPAVDGLPGQNTGPDAQCRQIYGTESYLCRGTNFGESEDVCITMFCKNPTTESTCTSNTAAPGTCCGNGKWCYDGACVANENATCYMSATCPFGQRQGPVLANGNTCEDLPSGHCYDDNFRAVCCEMCDRNYNVSRYDCEYGDKVTGCETQHCGRALDNGVLYDVQCCGTCTYTPTTLTPTTPTTTTTRPTQVPTLTPPCINRALINNTSCDNFLLSSSYGRKYCCQASVATACCDTCYKKLKLPDDSCPWGDCQICVLGNQKTACTTQQRLDCCRTCKDIDARLAPTTTTTTKNTATNTTTTTTTTTTPRPVKECKEVPGVMTCSASGLPVSVLMMAVTSLLFFITV